MTEDKTLCPRCLSIGVKCPLHITAIDLHGNGKAKILRCSNITQNKKKLCGYWLWISGDEHPFENSVV
jgi:hypothetical protein